MLSSSSGTLFGDASVEIDSDKLSDFIEKPVNNCSQKELEAGVKQILLALNKDSKIIMQIITGHVAIPTSDLLLELAEKMEKAKYKEQFTKFAEQHFDELMTSGVYNRYDVQRFLKALPACTNKIMDHIIANADLFKRILQSEVNPPNKVLEEFKSEHEKYQQQISEAYEKYFINARPKFQ